MQSFLLVALQQQVLLLAAGGCDRAPTGHICLAYTAHRGMQVCDYCQRQHCP